MCCFKWNCLVLSKLKLFINRNEYLTALYMLIAGQEVVYVTEVLRMLTQYFIHHKSFCCSAKINVYKPPRSPLFKKLVFAHFASWPRLYWKWLPDCSQTGLLDIHRGRHLPVGHFQSLNGIGLKIETERWITLVTHYVVIRMCTLNTCKWLQSFCFWSYIHTLLNTTLAVHCCCIYIDKYLLQALFLIFWCQCVWIIGNFQLVKWEN